ncbi:TPA: hypothetical protein NGS41_003346 [Vibrio parahaemolyticus]|nr:hypothetical protein [Vibrio parahaemolyticus]
MATATTTVRATGVPAGYVEHVRELSKNGKRVRAAMATGQMAKPNRRRRQLTQAEAQEEARSIQVTLGA